MNSDTVVQMLHQGFRVTLGATATLIEVLQDPEKRNENLSKLQTELSQLSEEWAEKGAVTEQDARNFVDSLIAKQRSAASGSGSGTPSTGAPTPTAPVDIQADLQELTAQIAAIRAELEKLRNSDS